MGALDELQAAIGAIAMSAGGSVVGIGAGGGSSGTADAPDEACRHRGRSQGRGAGWALGSGVVVAPGKVLTNAHNVRGSEVSVVFTDGRTENATLSAADFDGDLAVLNADTAGAPAIAWPADVAGPEIGTVVFALANRGGRGLRVTAGTVSSVGRGFRGPRGRRIAGSIEHTAAMARGSSGGPVVDANGRFVALNTNRAGDGFYLALPADAELARRVDALSQGREPYQPHLGIGIIPGRMARQLRHAVGLPERDGLLVREVEEGSPAAVAGLQQGDYIVQAAGADMASVGDLHKALEGMNPGESLELAILRGTEARTATLTLREAPAA